MCWEWCLHALSSHRYRDFNEIASFECWMLKYPLVFTYACLQILRGLPCICSLFNHRRPEKKKTLKFVHGCKNPCPSLQSWLILLSVCSVSASCTLCQWMWQYIAQINANWLDKIYPHITCCAYTCGRMEQQIRSTSFSQAHNLDSYCWPTIHDECFTFFCAIAV